MTMVSRKIMTIELLANRGIALKRLLKIIIWILTISALAVGSSMIAYPAGGLPGLELESLHSTYFKDFQWPGILLILIVGMPGLLTLAILRFQSPKAFHISFSFCLIATIWFLFQMLVVPDYAGISLFYLIVSVFALLCSMQLMGKRAL